MADVAEGLVPPPAMDQKGNTTIWWVPTIADVSAPKASTEIGATGAFRLTYSFTTDGWTLAGAQGTVEDNRLTIPQALESLDVNKVTLSLKYVDSLAAGSAAVVLAPTAPATTKSGYFVERRSVPNSTLAAAAQLVRVIPCTVGVQNPGPLDGNGKFTIVQAVAVTGIVGNPVALAA